MNGMMRPQIAIITPNTLTGIGLKYLISTIMPGAESCLFGSVDMLKQQDNGQFFHYFVSANAYMDDSSYFLKRIHKTIILVYGEGKGLLPEQVHTFNVCLSEESLVKSILKLEERAHAAKHPSVVMQAKAKTPNTLTKRETEVLRYIVSGLRNKEIADQLKVSLATIISHRKNIVEKLNVKSVSGLTIYAVTHGIIRAEEI